MNPAKNVQRTIDLQSKIQQNYNVNVVNRAKYNVNVVHLGITALMHGSIPTVTTPNPRHEEKVRQFPTPATRNKE